MRYRLWLPVGALALALGAAACGSTPSSSGSAATSPPVSTSSHVTLKTEHTSLGTVLATSAGRTVYWFSLDSSTASKCSGACLSYWPPVTGSPAAASGVTLSGKLGSITGTNGKTQATYNGHPLYMYSGDSAAGQTNGNLLKTFGGTWRALVLSGSGAAPSPSPSSSSGGGYGGGGGY